MSDEPSPRPWQVRYGDTVADSTGAKVAACWRPENAALIVEAVNEREELAAENSRLRKEVGRLRSAVKLLGAAAEPYCAPELRPVLIAEARAAIEEELNERRTK